jgi:hypothetical protein
VVENCWPIPNADGPARGVLVEGPVFSRWLGRWRVFRYEVRCWRQGVIADADEAVASPQLLSDDAVVARRLLELVGSLPSPGRASDRGNVEFQLGGRLAAGPKRPAHRRNPSSGRRTGVRLAGRPGRGPPLAEGYLRQM